jgi:flagellar motility protein MotE (MotC chaperone)
MKKVLKIFFIILLIIIGLAGAGFALLYFKIIPTPSFVSYIPVVSDLLLPEEQEEKKLSPEVIELQQAKRENASLKDTITEKQEEMKKLQDHLKNLEKEHKTSEDDIEQQKTEVARLNEEILNLKTSQSDKKAAYKDMATYFAEMKSKDAADILSRLQDEDIIGIFNEMPDDMVAEMLQKMDRNKATALTKKMLVTDS